MQTTLYCPDYISVLQREIGCVVYMVQQPASAILRLFSSDYWFSSHCFSSSIDAADFDALSVAFSSDACTLAGASAKAAAFWYCSSAHFHIFRPEKPKASLV